MLCVLQSCLLIARNRAKRDACGHQESTEMSDDVLGAESRESALSACLAACKQKKVATWHTEKPAIRGASYPYRHLICHYFVHTTSSSFMICDSTWRCNCCSSRNSATAHAQLIRGKRQFAEAPFAPGDAGHRLPSRPLRISSSSQLITAY